jgi:putative PIN family toxin of toxin-antitoxin system
MIKVVADTNIYISALFWRGNPYKFIHLCFEGKARLVISRQIIDELERILLTDGKFEMPNSACVMRLRLHGGMCLY